MTITLTREEVRTILEDYMEANYGIGDQKVVVETPLTDLPSTLKFIVKESDDFLGSQNE